MHIRVSVEEIQGQDLFKTPELKTSIFSFPDLLLNAFEILILNQVFLSFFSLIQKNNYRMQLLSCACARGWERRKKNNSFAKLAECMPVRKFTNYSDYSKRLTPQGITSQQ